jgi:hypothetical protein
VPRCRAARRWRCLALTARFLERRLPWRTSAVFSISTASLPPKRIESETGARLLQRRLGLPQPQVEISSA